VAATLSFDIARLFTPYVWTDIMHRQKEYMMKEHEENERAEVTKREATKRERW